MSEEEIEVEIEEEPTESKEDLRLKKMIGILVKQVGEVKGLEGKSLDEQFTMLEFLVENKPKPVAKPKAPNKPIVGAPTSQDKKEIGTLIYKNGDKLSMKFDATKVFKPWSK